MKHKLFRACFLSDESVKQFKHLPYTVLAIKTLILWYVFGKGPDPERSGFLIIGAVKETYHENF